MKSPSFNFYPNNWLGSSRVSTMTPAQEGAYIRLLCYQWNSENQTIPDDDEALAMLSRLGPGWLDSKRSILKCFHPVDGIPGALRNERLFHEFERIDALRKRRSAGGKKGMSSRWKTEKQESNNSVISELQVSNNREQGTGNRELGTEKRDQGSEKQQPPQPPKGEEFSDAFNQFWDAYPRKVGKKTAWKAFQRAKDKPPIADLVEEIKVQSGSQEWTKDGGSYIPYPATWLNRGGWEDYLTAREGS